MNIPDFGVFALLPPVVTIAAAFLTKQVLLSLFVGCFVAATMLAGFNPIVGLLNTFRDFVIAPLTPFNVSVLILILIIGGFTALLEKGGGARALAETAGRRGRTRKQGQIGAWFASCAIFFTDASPLIVGPVLKSFTDKLKISREKLSYIIDSTGCTIPGMHPMSSWGAFIVGLIVVQFDAIGYDGNPFMYFLASVPYQIYAWAAILMVVIVAVSGFDFGPMKRAEKRAVEEGKLYRDGAVLLRQEEETVIPAGAKITIWIMVVPIVVMLISIFSMFAYTGGFFTNPDITLVGSFTRAAALPSLIFSFFVGAVAAGIMIVRAKAFSVKETATMWYEGVKGNVAIILILIMAYGIGRASQAVGGPAFIVSVAGEYLTPTVLYIVVFIAAAITSFSTGTSWGTFSIFIPISVPLAYATGVPIAPAIGAAISGGIFGDHCSPISDTTIMSSLGGGCDIMDHVSTQLPYAIAAAAASVVGYFFAGVTESALIGLGSMLVALTIFAFGLNKFWGIRVGAARGKA